MADFDVFGSETTGGFQVSGSNEWFSYGFSAASSFAFINSSAIKRTAPISVASAFSLVSSASFKKTAYFTAQSVFALLNAGLVQRKSRAVQISMIYTTPEIRVVA